MIAKIEKLWCILSLRERIFLGLGVIIVSYLLMVEVIYKPWADHQAQIAMEIVSKRALLTWLEPAAYHIQLLRKDQKGLLMTQAPPLLSTIEETLRQAKLNIFMRGLIQSDNKTVRVQFSTVSFDALIIWLSGLWQKYLIAPQSFTASLAGAPGEVKVDLLLKFLPPPRAQSVESTALSK